MSLPHEKREHWLNFLTSEKTIIESKLNTIESIVITTFIGMISVMVAVVIASGDALVSLILAFPFMLFLLIYNPKRDKLANIRDSYALLIWDILTSEEIVIEDIRNEVKRLQKDERIMEGRE